MFPRQRRPPFLFEKMTAITGKILQKKKGGTGGVVVKVCGLICEKVQQLWAQSVPRCLSAGL